MRALAGGLREGSIQLASWVTRIALEGDHIRLTLGQTDGRSDSAHAAQVIAALPPRLLEASIAFEPATDPAIRLGWRDTQTWMSPHAKFVTLYDRPFWCTAGLSGMAQSAVGPMGEIHDATTASGAAALFGFLGVDADQRQAAGTALLTRVCLDQLVRLFGDACCDAWNNLIAETGRIRSLTDFEWARQVSPQCAWYETSTSDPGYLAGVMDAGLRAATEVLQRIATPRRAAS